MTSLEEVLIQTNSHDSKNDTCTDAIENSDEENVFVPHVVDDDDDDENSTSDGDSENKDNSIDIPPVLDARAARKAAKKQKKAQRRAQREGRADPSVGQKPCTVCGKSTDLLIRCQIDVTQQWHMVCGKCWHNVSGGVVDGSPNHPHYKYGGLWKNRAKRA